MFLSRRMDRSILLVVVVGVVLHVRPALAQQAERRVLELNQQAMEAYIHLDIEGAKALLIEALTIAEREGVEARSLAHTYVNLGVVTLGGDQDRRSALDFFKAGLQVDPRVAPDPDSSTPEVEETFDLARRLYEVETGTKLPDRRSVSTKELMAGLDDDELPPGMAESRDGEKATDPTEVKYDFGERKRTFVHFGFSMGIATVGAGQTADPQPPPECFDQSGALVPGCQSFVLPGEGACSGPDACVRVMQSGVLPVMGLRLAVGHYILPRLALAGTMRLGFAGGEGVMNQWMVGARAQYLFTSLEATGFNAAAFFGGSVGQIQTRPRQGEDVWDIFASPGLGSVQLGAVLGYRILRNFGFQLTPELHVFVPSGNVVLDLTVGIEAAF
jgi:hypothetical protein